MVCLPSNFQSTRQVSGVEVENRVNCLLSTKPQAIEVVVYTENTEVFIYFFSTVFQHGAEKAIAKSSAYANCLECVGGTSLMYMLNRQGANMDP